MKALAEIYTIRQLFSQLLPGGDKPKNFTTTWEDYTNVYESSDYVQGILPVNLPPLPDGSDPADLPEFAHLKRGTQLAAHLSILG